LAIYGFGMWGRKEEGGNFFLRIQRKTQLKVMHLSPCTYALQLLNYNWSFLTIEIEFMLILCIGPYRVFLQDMTSDFLF
jgi:hypothetical protein